MRAGISRHGTNPRRKAMLMIVGSLSIFAVVGLGAYLNRAPALDDATLCPSDRPPTANVVILVDTTDALTPTQAARLRATIKEARETTPTFGKLTLLFLDAQDSYEPKELVSLCNPGSPKEINPLFQTESRVRKRWMEAFGTPIDEAIEEILASPTANRSPIIEAITAVAWRPDFDSRAANRRLIIVSDMLQHDPSGYTQYGNGDLWRSFERSRLFQEADANLDGVDVEIEYLRRPSAGNLQNEVHRAFWQHWLVSRGAKAVRFVGTTDPDEHNTTVAGPEAK